MRASVVPVAVWATAEGGGRMARAAPPGGHLDDLDLTTGRLHLQRQVKRVRSQLVFGRPKNDKDRRVPLPHSVSAVLLAYVTEFASVSVTPLWEDPDSDKLVTVPLVFTTPRRNAINRSDFNPKSWHKALAAVGIVEVARQACTRCAFSAPRRYSTRGESIRVLSAYLGHADPGFTLRIYMHLMPSSEDPDLQGD